MQTTKSLAIMKSIQLTDQLYSYMLEASLQETQIQSDLRKKTALLPGSIMQIPPEQAQFMGFLTKLIGAKNCIEIGVYTGYSALSVALSLPKDGRLIACDVDPVTTEVARRYWQKAGVSERIDLRIGPALETLRGLIDDGESGKYDMAFIDADKTEYQQYFENLMLLLRPGGLLIADNILWFGRVADNSFDDEDTKALRAFTLSLRDDPRVSTSLLPVADGLLLAIKL
jgi:predicted O-methyltransferase YrrM